MTQVSRRVLDKRLEGKMYDLLWEAIGESSSTNDIISFFEDLLSPTERLMLSKRLAIAFLLVKGYDHRTISEILKVSSTTVARVNFWLTHKGQGYRKAINRLLAKRRLEAFFLQIDEFWTQMTPKIGRGEHLKEIHRRKREQTIL